MASSARFGPLAAQARKAAAHARPRRRRHLRLFVVLAVALAGLSFAVVIKAMSGDPRSTAVEKRVSALLSGIPEHGATLGRPTAPVTLVFYGDLECKTTRKWVLEDLPGIIARYVRPGRLRIEFRAFKTDTHDTREFIAQQTAALAAGAQNRLWPFIETFYYEQGVEYTPYVTDGFLTGIANQVPDLDLEQWRADRDRGRRSELVAEEDQSARKSGLHDTPAFQLGPTGGELRNFSGRSIVKFAHEPNPVSLIDAQDLAAVFRRLTAVNRTAVSHG